VAVVVEEMTLELYQVVVQVVVDQAVEITLIMQPQEQLILAVVAAQVALGSNLANQVAQEL
jgi:hypothetical protein